LIFESFTASALRTIERAARIAQTRGAALIEPLDLLGALASEPESRAVGLLAEFGLPLDELRKALNLSETAAFGDEELFGRDAGPGDFDGFPLSADARIALSEASAQARAIDRKREVGTEHLLAGLLACYEPATLLLRSAGLEIGGLLDRLNEEDNVDLSPLPLAEGIPALDLTEGGGGVDLGRILDASVNRAREGLRVVEDYVRFVLDDPGLTRRLKDVRHRFAQAERGLDANLLFGSRDTRGDVGTHIMTVSEQIRENPRAVLAANFKRTQEALRSLEEYSKLVDVWVAGRFEVLRYDLYTLEKLTMTAVAAHRSLANARLMVLAGGLPTMGDLTWVVSEALAGGADVIQLREKDVPDRELLKRARDIRILTAQARVPLIMNDRVDLARLASCDGVQLGQDDLSARDARRLLGPTALIGISTHDPAQLDAAVLSGASYLGVGPVFPSRTKEFSEPELAGLAYVRQAAEATAIPWFAIGGITEDNVERVLEAGATRIAVSAAVLRASRPRQAASRLKELLVGAATENGD
jgi:thiamine-phosphate pyrophosphorylase